MHYSIIFSIALLAASQIAVARPAPILGGNQARGKQLHKKATGSAVQVTDQQHRINMANALIASRPATQGTATNGVGASNGGTRDPGVAIPSIEVGSPPPPAGRRVSFAATPPQANRGPSNNQQWDA